MDNEATKPAMNLFERYLTLWVGLCIFAGIGLGHFMPEPFQLIGQIEIARVNLPVAVLIWLMIISLPVVTTLMRDKFCSRSTRATVRLSIL